VATVEGVLVNQHLGQALQLQIWEQTKTGFNLVEERLTPESGTGFERWQKLANNLQDCRAILASGMGDNPKQILSQCGIMPIELSGFINLGLKAVYEGEDLSKFKRRKQTECTKFAAAASECQGDGLGCG
jgi:nitrogen fixation protein NifB